MFLKRLIHRYINQQPRVRLALTRLIEGKGEVTVSLFGTPLRIDKVRENGYLRASRLANLSSVFGEEAPVLVKLASLVPHVDTFIDAGANVGLYTSVLGRLQRLHPSFRCVAFEADPSTFTRLVANASHPHQQCYNVALSDSRGSLTFVRGAVSHVTTTTENANAYSLRNETFTIPCRRLDSFDVPGGKLMLKIDVEGQELRVLRGASRWFDEGRCAVVYLDGYESRAEIQGYLRERGFTLLDGRCLDDATEDNFSLLAVHGSWLAETRNDNG